MLIRAAEIDGCAPLDVRVADGRIAAVGPSLPRAPHEPLLDARGGALLPGLHDHHTHLLALAAALASVACGPPRVRDEDALARALAAASPGADGWIRGVGYHEAVAGTLDRSRLDGLRDDVPVRVQHRSGACWSVNSAGAQRLGLDRGADAPGVERDARGRASGRLFRLDGWLRERLPRAAPDLALVGRRLAACGVTGVTDAGVGNGAPELALLEAALTSGALPQRLVAMGRRDLPAPRHPRATRGAVKVILDEARLPPLDALVRTLAAAHARGRPAAVHCVTRSELVLAAAALREAGARPGDRIEHASVAPPDVTALVATLPVTVVTQPGFVRERGDDYRRDVAAADLPWLYRVRAWLEAGVPLGAGSDAPFGDPDPWRAIRAAVDRRTRDGAVLGPEECVAPERALALFLSPPEAPGAASRRVAAGEPADLCLLDRPWREARERLSSRCVAATVVDGRVVHRRDGEPPAGAPRARRRSAARRASPAGGCLP